MCSTGPHRVSRPLIAVRARTAVVRGCGLGAALDTVSLSSEPGTHDEVGRLEENMGIT